MIQYRNQGIALMLHLLPSIYDGMWCLTVLDNFQPAVKTVVKSLIRSSYCDRNFIGARHTGIQASSMNIE